MSRNESLHRSLAELLEVARAVCGVRSGVARLIDEEPIVTGAPVPNELEKRLSERVAALSVPFASFTEEWSRDVRFYAAAKLVDSNGRFRGTVALLDDRRRALSTEHERVLKMIAGHLSRELERADAGEEYFRALTDHLTDVIAIVTREEVLTYVSPSVLRVLGVEPEEQVGRRLSDALRVHPEDRERLANALQELSRGGRVDCVECRFRHSNGRWRTFEVAGKNLLNDDQIHGVVVNLHDITERKRMEHELAQLSRLTSLGRLAAQVAHEFNNVLMGIQPIVEVIRRRNADDAAMLRFTDVICASIARGKRITSDILRFGRPAQLTLRSVGVEELLRHAADEIRPSLPNGIVLDVAVAESPMCIHADASQLAQVLVNLALNAREAMQERGGMLSIAARRAEEGEVGNAERFIHFTVSDTGAGISSDDLPYIFEPLFTTKQSGTGLGLSVVMQIVAAHGGHVSVESEVGRGTTFHLFIPSAAPDESRTAARADSSHASRSLRVLIVEDEETIADGLRWGLEGEGMTVRVVGTGAEVLPALSEFEPDVVVLDLSLPDEDGASVYARIAAHHDVPVVFSSGHATEAEMEQLADPERAAFLTKPYSLDELLATMERLT